VKHGYHPLHRNKKSGASHGPEEIAEFIRELVAGNVPDYQAAAWLMAVNFVGLDPDETVELTKAIVDSGNTASYQDLPGPVVDKHSTGGVGDKVTLVLLPILAAMGMYIPKHSGRALGFTGGTIDKLESIPGFDAFPSEERFREIVRDVGFAIGGQSESMCPADGILYALRDATSTVNETGLIAASVMSKKIAGGAEHILIDVKVGQGAFMKDEASARELAERLVYVGTNLGRNVRCLITRMSQPLGRTVGNELELYETVECLTGNGPDDVMEICRASAIELCKMCGIAGASEAGLKFDEAVASGAAIERFRRFVEAHGGSTRWIDGDERLPETENVIVLKYDEKDAFIQSIDALAIGEIVRRMGGGRLTKDDSINHSVGVEFLKKPGDKIETGDILAKIYTRSMNPGDLISDVRAAFEFSETKPEIPELIIDRV
jgi:pyrimidine-nucleoside phosphorylase